jgi:Zn-finger in ubiquitin-hydrolases and other protein
MSCLHIIDLQPVPPHALGCEEWLRLGTPWVHLRFCVACGHVGCCDISPFRHATKHFHKTGHPVVASFEPGERWAWCFIDQTEMAVPEKFEPYLRE